MCFWLDSKLSQYRGTGGLHESVYRRSQYAGTYILGELLFLSTRKEVFNE